MKLGMHSDKLDRFLQNCIDKGIDIPRDLTVACSDYDELAQKVCNDWYFRDNMAYVYKSDDGQKRIQINICRIKI